MVFTEQKFEEFPTSGSPTLKFRIPQKVSNRESQQAEFSGARPRTS